MDFISGKIVRNTLDSAKQVYNDSMNCVYIVKRADERLRNT